MILCFSFIGTNPSVRGEGKRGAGKRLAAYKAVIVHGHNTTSDQQRISIKMPREYLYTQAGTMASKISSQYYYLAPAHKETTSKMSEKVEGKSATSPKAEESSVLGILPASHWQNTKVCMVYRSLQRCFNRLRWSKARYN